MPRLDETWSIATHNSYWVNRDVPGDISASGVEERLADQLLVDHVRGLELDIHKATTRIGSWDVFHTEPGDSLCDTLEQCLQLIRAVHHALPQHDAITVVLELKELDDSNFDLDHTVDDLDALLRAQLGAALFEPKDLLARCAAKNFCVDDVRACVAAVGWPAVDELRGRVLFGVMGNWDGLGAPSTADWAEYATHGPAGERAAFAMASSWKLQLSALPADEQSKITQAQLDAAFAASGLLQSEDLHDTVMASWLAGHGVVRLDGAEAPADQQACAATGAELLQTDLPWSQYDDLGLATPLRSFRAGDAPSLLREPGNRAELLPPQGADRVFAYQQLSTSSTNLESLIAAGASASPIGCLRAASALGQGGETSISLCRAKIESAERTQVDAGKLEAETVDAVLTECAAGACTTTTIASAGGPDAPGDLLQLSLAADGRGGSCATPRAASAIDPQTFAPTWTDLAPAFCPGALLGYQGLAREAASDGSGAPVLFTGTRRDGDDLLPASLTAVLEPADGGSAPAANLLVVP